MKRVTAKILAMLLVLTLCTPAAFSAAAAAPKLKATKATITGVGSTYALKVLNQPKGTTLTFSSSKKEIATVSAKGIVTAKKRGQSTITCNIKKSKKLVKKLTCVVTVVVPAKKIAISNAVLDETEKAHMIKMGETFDFNCIITSNTSKSASSYKGFYKIEDETIATVNDTGIVTPKKVGKTKLTVYAGLTKESAVKEDNPIKDSVYIKVTDTPLSIIGTPSLTSSKTLTVNFSHPMNASTLFNSNGELTGNIKLIRGVYKDTPASDPGDLKGSLSSDMKTLTITSTKELHGIYHLLIRKGAMTLNSQSLEDAYFVTLNLIDDQAPQYMGTKTDETGFYAVIQFNEPLDITNLRIDNVKKNNVSATNYLLTLPSNYTLSSDKKSILFNMGILPTEDRNSAYTVDLYGIKDTSGNISNTAYTVNLFADVSTKPQATCLSVYRSGNSLIATFDLPIQNPGYATINGTNVFGMVNGNNRKEVIYSLANTYLADLKDSNVLVTLFDYSGYNTASSSSTTSTQKYVNFAYTVNPLVITEKTLTTQTVNHVTKNILTLTFNKEISFINTSGNLAVTEKNSDTVLPAVNYSFTASFANNVATIEFKDNFSESSAYTISLPENFVMDIYSNGNKATDVTVRKTGGTAVPLPAPVSIQLDALNNSVVYVTFNDKLDRTSAETVSNYYIQDHTIQSASVISSGDNSPTVIKLSLSKGVKNDLPYAITISNIKGSNGSYQAMETYKNLITLTSNQTLICVDISAFAESNKLVITTAGTISANSISDYIFKIGSKTLTVKSNVIKDNTITYTFDEKLTAGSVITAVPTVKNNIKDASNSTMLNTAFTVSVK